MRVLKNIDVPQNEDSRFPFSTIKNETETEQGTPVVEEIYGDIITNLYKLLQLSGVTPTNTQDNDLTQYQLVEALQKLPNLQNDIEQVLSLSGDTWSLNLNLDYIPNKYFLFAKASENYVKGVNYFVKGVGSDLFPFTSVGFKSGDTLLIILDRSSVRAMVISSGTSSGEESVSFLGTPISYNDSTAKWCSYQGTLFNNEPKSLYLQSTIRTNMGDPAVVVLDFFVDNGKVLCFCVIPATNNYFFRAFSLTDMSVSVAVIVEGFTISSASDFSPYVFMDNGFVYMTNGGNNTANDYRISKLQHNFSASKLTFINNVDVATNFVKTTNSVIKDNLIITMVGTELYSFNLSTGVRLGLGEYPIPLGQLIKYNGNIYYYLNSVGIKLF